MQLANTIAERGRRELLRRGTAGTIFKVDRLVTGVKRQSLSRGIPKLKGKAEFADYGAPWRAEQGDFTNYQSLIQVADSILHSLS